MPSPYDKSLSSLGLLDGSKLTEQAVTAYIDDVLALLREGNSDGKGGSPSMKALNSLVAIPPIGGPQFLNESFFWFSKEKDVDLVESKLRDRSKSEQWHSTFIDNLFEKTAVSLDVPGSTPFFPVFDASAAFPNVKGFPLTPDQLAAQVNMAPPDLLSALADLGIEVKVPSPPMPPVPPPLPSFPFEVPAQTVPSLTLNDFSLALTKLPFDALQQLIAPPDLKLVTDLPNLPKTVAGPVFDSLLAVSAGLKLQQAPSKVYAASVAVYAKNVIGMICVNVVSMLVGSGGSLAKSVSAACGLTS